MIDLDKGFDLHERRNWFFNGPKLEPYPNLIPEEIEVELAGSKEDLVIACQFYLANRHENYVNYMTKGRFLFELLTRGHNLGGPCTEEGWPDLCVCGHVWNPTGEQLRASCRHCVFKGWNSAYECERVVSITGIHGSWVAWGMVQAIKNYIDSGRYRDGKVRLYIGKEGR